MSNTWKSLPRSGCVPIQHPMRPAHSSASSWLPAATAICIGKLATPTRPVLQLPIDIEQLTRGAVARTEMSIVEHEARVALRAKALRIGIEPHFLDSTQPVRHHDDRKRARPARLVQPATAMFSAAACYELDIFSPGHVSPKVCENRFRSNVVTHSNFAMRSI